MRRVSMATFESDPEPILDEVERERCVIAVVRDGVDVLLLSPASESAGEE